MQTHRSFLEEIIDETTEIFPMEGAVFDRFLQGGWRLLGRSVIRHNFAACRGRICQTIPLRIRLDRPLDFSKSQRQLLRKNADFRIVQAPIALTPEKESLFKKHTQRFEERQPLSVYSFLHPMAWEVPTPGLEFSIFDGNKHIASSFIHLGENAVSGTYCFFDTEYARRSLGTFTMLLELEYAQSLGKQFYYHGYCYDVPSQFDYKMNFNNLEAMDWKSEKWSAHPRVPARQWNGLIGEQG